MSDIFREVEEEVRRERYAKLWKEYGDYIIAIVAIVIIGAAGGQLWRYYQHQQTIKASDEYQATLQTFDANNPLGAAQAFQKLAQSAPAGYALVSQLQEANALLAAGKRDDALKLYKTVAGGSDPILASLARLRTAWAIVDTAPKSEVQSVLAPLTDPTSPWRFMARELLAYDDYRLGDMTAAQKEYEALANEAQAPQGLRQRCNAMANFIKAGGDHDVGVVPPAPAAPIPGATAPAKPAAAPAGAPQQ